MFGVLVTQWDVYGYVTAYKFYVLEDSLENIQRRFPESEKNDDAGQVDVEIKEIGPNHLSGENCVIYEGV